MTEIENWCLGSWEQQTDYLLAEWFEDNLPTLYQQDDIIFEYNQNKWSWSKKSCTIFSAIWAISDLFNYEFTQSEIKEIDDRSYTLGRFPNEWWWVQSAVKLVADWWNEKHSDLWKVAYYRFDITNDNLLNSIINKWYTVMTNIRGNGKYQMDYLRDDILNWTEFWASTYGHALSVINYKGKRSVKDNYKWRLCNDSKTDCNIFELEHEISEISVFWTNWYIYTKVAEDALEEVKRLNKMKTLTERMILDNSTMWHLSNDAAYRTKLHDMNERHRAKLRDIEEQLAKYM
jgi:hypothetical protein